MQITSFNRPTLVQGCHFSRLALVLVVAGLAALAHGQGKGEIDINLVAEKSDQQLDCRVQLRSPSGQVLKPRAIDFVAGWSLVEGKLTFRAQPGDYQYQVFHGPEFAPARGRFTLDKNSETIDRIELPRHANLADEGWFGGDLLSFRPKQKTDLWLNAEALTFAASVAEINQVSNQNSAKFAQQFSGVIDNRPESGLTIHHWMPNVQLPLEAPSAQWLVLAKKATTQSNGLPVHVEIQNLCARDLPIWLASGRIDSVQLLSLPLTYDGSRAAKVAPLETPQGNYRSARGPGKLVEQIYWKILDAGLRIPPTAGSGFGKSPSPLGYNRVYARTSSINERSWWEAIRLGHSFVSNGPLLRVAINGMPPGHIFKFSDPLALDISVALTTADPVEYLEIIFNGTSIYKAALDEYARNGGKIPPLEIQRSGWLMARVVTARDFTYRIACTAPFYFEHNGQNRVDPQAVKFFQNWLIKAKQQIMELPPSVQELHRPYLDSAERFWNDR